MGARIRSMRNRTFGHSGVPAPRHSGERSGRVVISREISRLKAAALVTFLAVSGNMMGTTPAAAIDRTCDNAAYPSAEWARCEAQNYAMTTQAPTEQASNPAFLVRLQAQSLANQSSWNARVLGDPSWLGGTAANTPVTPLCTTWMQQCAGDPFRYREATGPDGGGFYAKQAQVTPFVYYDEGCARINGRVWLPANTKAGAKLPNVVIETGSIQAPETLYWWFAQQLVRNGYAVMTFDVRGQGRSDQQTPSGGQGSNLDSSVFWNGLVNAIDFWRSTPTKPYPHNARCASSYPTKVTSYNPIHNRLDPARLGIAGHSLGATGVSIVAGYGAPGADPWPGKIDARNPVKTLVAWDSLVADGEGGSSPKAVPRVPAMGQSSEYGIGGAAFTQPPDAAAHLGAYSAWKSAHVPVYVITVRGSTHFEWSLIPTFPATSWCADTSSGACKGAWGNALAQHYSLAWMDRWLKKPGEPGYKTADARLLDDGGPDGIDKFSYRFTSARSFPDRQGALRQCEDIRKGC